MPKLVISHSPYHPRNPLSLQIRHGHNLQTTRYELIARIDKKTADRILVAGKATKKSEITNNTLSLTVARKEKNHGLPFNFYLEDPEKPNAVLLASIGEETARSILECPDPAELNAT